MGAELLELAKSVNKQIEHHEIIDRVFIVAKPWTPENVMLTPTLKIKRNVVESTYESLMEKYRDSKVRVVWETDES